MKYVVISQNTTQYTWTQPKYGLENKPELSLWGKWAIFFIIGNFAHCVSTRSVAL